jgi:hypothetical protein
MLPRDRAPLRLERIPSDRSEGRFSFLGLVRAEYWIYGESDGSGKGEPIKIKVEESNEPLKIVIPFPKREG